jgi:hypothetical protein
MYDQQGPNGQRLMWLETPVVDKLATCAARIPYLPRTSLRLALPQASNRWRFVETPRARLTESCEGQG